MKLNEDDPDTMLLHTPVSDTALPHLQLDAAEASGPTHRSKNNEHIYT